MDDSLAREVGLERSLRSERGVLWPPSLERWHSPPRHDCIVLIVANSAVV